MDCQFLYLHFVLSSLHTYIAIAVVRHFRATHSKQCMFILLKTHTLFTVYAANAKTTCSTATGFTLNVLSWPQAGFSHKKQHDFITMVGADHNDNYNFSLHTLANTVTVALGMIESEIIDLLLYQKKNEFIWLHRYLWRNKCSRSS